jgi:arylamine N-acetyltransferase
MLTFKDHGMSVGKIDKSWNDLTKEQFRIVEEGKSNFIVKAINTKTKKTLYFNISKKGEIKDVKDGSAFSDGHGHSH